MVSLNLFLHDNNDIVTAHSYIALKDKLELVRTFVLTPQPL